MDVTTIYPIILALVRVVADGPLRTPEERSEHCIFSVLSLTIAWSQVL
jgi:hypothetical protein